MNFRSLLLLLAFLFLSAIPLSRSNIPLLYDESVYMGVIREIAHTGRPTRAEVPRNYPFFTHPPLVLLGDALVEKFFPGNIEALRWGHSLLFVIPVIACILWAGWGMGGFLTAFLALLSFWLFDRVIEQSERVVLDLVLGGVSLWALSAYSRCLDGVGKWGNLFCACLLGTATKFQFITVPAAFFALHLWEVFRIRKVPKLQSFAVAIGGCAVGLMGVLLYFYWAYPAELLGTFGNDFARFGGNSSFSLWEWLRQMRSVGLRAIHFLGPATVLGLLLLSVQREPRTFTRVGLFFVGMSLLFNAVAYRLPGAGTYYLTAATPVISVLLGVLANDAFSGRVFHSRYARILPLGVLALFAWRLGASDRNIPYRVSIPEPLFEKIGKEIQAQSPPQSAVLAFHPEMGIYAARRVGLLQYLNDEQILEALRDPRTTHIVIPEGYWPSLQTRPQGAEIRKLMESAYERMEGFAPIDVFVRRGMPRLWLSEGLWEAPFFSLFSLSYKYNYVSLKGSERRGHII